ncbi:MAG: hypothetical protein P1V36_03720 [Planctomycetota bacterium]|nr:hypothetical protein [Planctomycetota bacterium]
MMQRLALTYLVAVTLLAMGGLAASAGETGALPPDRITQQQIASGAIAQTEIRRQGLIIFSTPFNRHDGYGDDERPTMGGNGTFLRINGPSPASSAPASSVRARCRPCSASVVSAARMPTRS